MSNDFFEGGNLAVNVDRILAAFGAAFARVQGGVSSEADRRGAMLSIRNPRRPDIPSIRLPIEVVSEEKYTKYSDYADRKALVDGTTGTSRTNELGIPGGVIVSDTKSYGLSGLSCGDADEAVVLLAAIKLGELTLEQAWEIAKAGNNKIFGMLQAANEFAAGRNA